MLTGGIVARASNPPSMRKAVGIAFLAYTCLVIFFMVAYALGSTQFNLPPGPPIVAAVSVVLAFAAMTQVARRRS